MKSIPIIDLFAGPGGLGEGFSSFTAGGDRPGRFQIALSIEKDPFAHKTLVLRSFLRKFGGNPPSEYHEYLFGCEIGSQTRLTREDLFAAHPYEAEDALREAWNAELGHELFPDSEVDKRIESALGGAKTWVLIGGPPCQAYSLVGRSRMRGADPEKYENDHRHLLYKQYLRILARHQPAIFVMENVKGILSSQHRGESIFDRILADLRQPGASIGDRGGRRTEGYTLYSLVDDVRAPRSGTVATLFDRTETGRECDPHRFVVRCEEYGIPQARHRVIVLGIRNDAVSGLREGLPGKLKRSSRQVTVRDRIEDLPKLRSRVSREKDSPGRWVSAVRGIQRDSVLEQIRQLEQVARIDRNQLVTAVKSHVRQLDGSLPVQVLESAEGRRIYNHATKSHMEGDLHRYLFAACFAMIHPEKRSPMLAEFPLDLLPAHKNVAAAVETDKFGDRFRVQCWDRPSTTITSHLSKDGHYFIHPDPLQCRSLTVREAARLQTFPDDYFFEGPRTAQYLQVGNAVPPGLAHQIAAIVYHILD